MQVLDGLLKSLDGHLLQFGVLLLLGSLLLLMLFPVFIDGLVNIVVQSWVLDGHSFHFSLDLGHEALNVGLVLGSLGIGSLRLLLLLRSLLLDGSNGNWDLPLADASDNAWLGGQGRVSKRSSRSDCGSWVSGE